MVQHIAKFLTGFSAPRHKTYKNLLENLFMCPQVAHKPRESTYPSWTLKKRPCSTSVPCAKECNNINNRALNLAIGHLKENLVIIWSLQAPRCGNTCKRADTGSVEENLAEEQESYGSFQHKPIDTYQMHNSSIL